MAAKYTDTITTDAGTVLEGATVELLTGAGALVTTYTDDALTQNAATSRTADANGLIELYVADGTYSVRTTYNGVVKMLANVELYDISTIASTSSGAVANKAQASAVGISGSAENMGPYTSPSLTDNQTAKQNIEELGAAADARPTSATLAAPDGAALIGTANFSGVTIPDGSNSQQALQALETAVESKAPLAFSQATSYPAGSVGERLARTVYITDAPYNAPPGDGEDATAEIQQAIDETGSGATIIVPRGLTFRADGLRLDGSSGTLNNVTLHLEPGSRIRARAGATNNVIEAITGSGHKITGSGRISGSKDTGGAPVRPPSRGFWVTATVYAVNDRVEVSSADAATTTVDASNLVYRCTTAHTAGATFAGDKATKWTLVAEPNFDTVDLSYRYRNGVYFGAGIDRDINGVEIDQCVYACINLGSGPVQAANIGGALQRSRVNSCRLHDSENSIAGGNWQSCTISDNLVYNIDIYGVVSDIQCSSNIIADNTLIGKSGSTNAIFLYCSEHAQIKSNVILGAWTNGVVADNSAHYSSICDNMIISPTNISIFVRSSAACKVKDNTINGSGSSGVELSLITGGLVGGNVSYGNGGAGVKVADSAGVSVQGNETNFNAAPGLDFSDSSACPVSGNESRQNSHGIRSTGTSTGLTVTGNDFSSNGTAESLVGANVVGQNQGGTLGVTHLGASVAAPSNAANFVAQTIIPIKDASGTTRYVPAMNATW